MQLSKLTFSLASLVVLIAFGLIFVPASVMAHDALDDGTKPGNLTHPHPLIDALPEKNLNPGDGVDQDNDVVDPGEALVAAHGAHPMPKITLKPNADIIDGKEIIVTATAATFTVIISFVDDAGKPMPVATRDNATEAVPTPITGGSTNWGVLVLDKDGDPITNGALIANSMEAALADDNEAVVTVETVGRPADMDDRHTIRIQLNAVDVFSLQETHVEGVTPKVVPGGRSVASAIAEFTLVQSFTAEEDTTAPTVKITVAGEPDAMGNIVFTLAFDKALASTGLGALSVSDIEITGGTAAAADLTAKDNIYTLAVTPTDADTSVTISLRADSITDAAGNVLVTMDAMDETLESVMGVYDKTAPTVTITSPEALDADGNVVFTIDFSEAPGDNGLTVADLSVSNTAPLKVADLVEVEGTMAAPLPDGVAMRYTLTVTPTDATMPNVLDLAAGSVADASGNMVDGERETYTPPLPDAPAAPTGLTVTAGDEKVTLQWTVVADASYQYRKKSGTATFMADGSDYTDIAAADLMAVTGSTTMKMFEVTGLTGDTEYTFEVRVKADGATPAGAAALATATPTSAVTGGLAIGDTRDNVTEETEFTLAGMLASNSFAIFTAVANGAIEGETAITGLPNLQRFFAKGGTISLVGPTGTTAKSVVISEIMWGLNLAAEEVAEQPDYQWIELLNTDNALSDTDDTNDAAAAIDLSTYKLVFTPGTVVPKPAAMSDQVSNVEFLGWDVNIGQSGKLGAASATFTPDDLVSMYRKINYTNLTKKHGDKNAADNRVEQLKAIPGGSAEGGWDPSTVNDTYAINQLGSPGAQHFEGRSETTATSATYAVVINEVGNNTGDSYDWIELLNTGTTEVNLKKWEITNITGADTETALVSFPDNDNHKIPAGGILLVVNSDPYRNPAHPVAAGTIINSDKLREEKTGINSRYYVSSGLKLRDDGKMALLVRNANDKEKQPTNVIDFTGPRPFNNIVDLSSKYRTNQWPLRAQGAGGNDVFKDLAEEFSPGRIYFRQNTGAGNSNDTWRKAGYSGVGYKRGASGDGTPGYPNSIVQATETALATASAGATVTISEIMYDRGDRDNLPQWIELYNSSDTHAVNLDGWKLKIENADDVDVRRTVTIANLGGTIIPPNQTVLIVAYTTGRVSRGSQGRDDFPSKRVINLSGKAELEIAEDATKRNYRLLSETAFQLTLIEKDGTVGVDAAGNLGADGTAMWALPMAEDGAGRSSIIRRYDKDVDTNGDRIGLAIDRDGTMIPPADGTGAWLLASTSDLSEVQVNETYYGSPDDVGTPGYRGGGALPVSLSKFRPERLDSGEIVVRWITESELNNAGFNILRSDARDGEFTKLNTKLIAGQGTTSERTVYSFPDTTAKPNVVYYYQIQDVSLDGKVQTLRQSRIKGYVSPSGKLTTTWGDLKLQD